MHKPVRSDDAQVPVNQLPDGRKPFEWKSKYPAEANKSIRFEAGYLVILLHLTPILLFAFWVLPSVGIGNLSEAQLQTISKYGLTWVGGVLGGTLFSLKWLYHSVARGLWHLGRRCWRLYTPAISGGLAFVIVALISSGILRIFDGQVLSSGSSVVGLSFLIGYFSDSAIAKLSELADTLFGSRLRKQEESDPHGEEPPVEGADGVPGDEDHPELSENKEAKRDVASA